MLHPRSLVRRISSSGLRRRPSAAMLVALLALFLAAGGASYAATSLPNNSVGTEQIKNSAVTNPKIANEAVGNHKLASEAVGWRKIIPGTIGTKRVNKDQVQLRVTGTCTSGQALTAVQNNGKVTCGQTSPAEFNGGQSNPVAITSPTTATPITGVSLGANSSYLVTANPQIAVNAATNARGHIVVNCTLAVAGSTTATQTRSVSFDVGFGNSGGGTVTATLQQQATLPLEVSAPSNTGAQPAQVTCVRSLSGDSIGTPTVSAAGTVTAIQTGSNTSLPSTVTNPPALPTPTNPPTTTTTTTPTP